MRYLYLVGINIGDNVLLSVPESDKIHGTVHEKMAGKARGGGGAEIGTVE